MDPTDKVWTKGSRGDRINPRCQEYRNEVTRRWEYTLTADALAKKSLPTYRQNPKLGAPRPGQWPNAKSMTWLAENPINVSTEVEFIMKAIRIQKQLLESMGPEGDDDDDDDDGGGDPTKKAWTGKKNDGRNRQFLSLHFINPPFPK